MPPLTDVPIWFVFFVGLVLFVLAAFFHLRSGRAVGESLFARLESLEKAQEKTERALREEMAQNREEQRNASRSLREEVTAILTALAGTLSQAMSERAAVQKGQLEDLTAALGRFSETGDRRLTETGVVIAGPTTLWALLNSLQMDFRTLAIQKRTGEIWELLGAVKTEWIRYGEMLDAVHRKLSQASETVEKVQVRSRAIGRRLRDVQSPLQPADDSTSGGDMED